MKKIPLLTGLICFAIYRILLYLTNDILLSFSIFLLPLGLLVLNYLLRKNLRFASWFLHPANIFLERKTQINTTDLPSNLLIDKLEEVINTSEFELYEIDKVHFKILCGTSPNLLTWGENIYINIRSAEDENEIHFTSVTTYGTSSWGRNDQNFDSFVQQFETSLTI